MKPAPFVLLALLPLAACAPETAPPPTPARAAQALALTLAPVALPGASGAVSLDYLAVNRAAGRVWIPAGGTGSVDVLDEATGKITRIEGFPTVEREVRGQKRVMGPSSATVGEGVVYVGNRANAEVCAVDAARLTRGVCIQLPSSPDGLQYVAATKEVWVTTPHDKSITVIDASVPGKLTVTSKISLDGEPEGYAVDQARGVFYTNLEDGNKTLVIDAKTHRVTATWDPRCGAEGPRGLALDAVKGFLFVACTDHIQVLDAGHGGAPLSQLAAGEGVDNIDYLEPRGQVYIAAGKAGTLTVARVDDKGVLTALATVPTSAGTRVVVAGKGGSAYVADGKLGRILVLTPAP